MLFEDPLIWKSLSVTAQYAVIGVPIRLFAQLFIAMLLNHSLRGVAIFRSMIYLPSVVSGVALALVWILLFNGTFGLFNYLLWEILRIQGPNWLNSTQWVIPAFIIMSFWQMGPGIVIDLAGLQGIPRELYEAAEIDGANAVSKFITITLPMMSPLLLFNLIMGIVANFQVFTQAYVMTSGGPSNASLFYVLYLYRNAFEFFKMGYASAMAWLLFFVILLLTLLVFKSSPLWVFYQEKR
jgi:multiple sugar transport system permease protein